ncbi:hypothetical protein [Micromonospora aurantiaca (nom. illeg.)]|uniref:hypothetical protein n=1 Tax=Micromonospora aurantiaca (nom. illeg.) TaxID=47850 RepID=UPI0033F9227F
MTSPRPRPCDLHTIRTGGLVHELARAYLDRRPDEVLNVDARLRDEVTVAPSGLSREVVERMPTQSAALMCEDYLRLTKSQAELLLPGARQLAAGAAPPALRDELALALNRLVAGSATLFDRPAAAEPPGMLQTHLDAAVVAAAIDNVHPCSTITPGSSSNRTSGQPAAPAEAHPPWRPSRTSPTSKPIAYSSKCCPG